jgi:aspartate-semialdehyde dehydrogenase
MSKIGVAILGASGAVGQTYRKLLSNHPYFEIRLLTTSEQNVGCAVDEYILESSNSIEKALALDVKIVFSCLNALDAQQLEPIWALHCLVISSASTFRDAERLILPEINGHKVIGARRGIFAKSNCTVHPIVLSMQPLMQFGIERVSATTLQAMSGAGKKGLAAMDIVDNIIPYIAEEETKIQQEVDLLLGQPIPLFITCCRVPVIDGHMVCMELALKHPFSLEEVEQKFLEKNYIQICRQKDRPQPRLDRDWLAGMGVSIGRIRRVHGKSIMFVALSHNRIRGAAGTGIKIAEIAYGIVQPD